MSDFAKYQVYKKGNYVLVSDERSIYKIINRTENDKQPHLSDFILEKLGTQEKLSNVKHSKFEKIGLNEIYLIDFGFNVSEEITRKIFITRNLTVEDFKSYQGSNYISKVYKKDNLIIVDETLPKSYNIYHIYIEIEEKIEYFKINSIHSLQNFLEENKNITEIDFDEIMLKKISK